MGQHGDIFIMGNFITTSLFLREKGILHGDAYLCDTGVKFLWRARKLTERWMVISSSGPMSAVQEFVH